MTVHLPTHPTGYAEHHALRNTLIVVGAIALAIVLFAAVMLVRPTATTTTSQSAMERMIEFRAGERALYTAPMLTDAERAIEFRAGERELWTNPSP